MQTSKAERRAKQKLLPKTAKLATGIGIAVAVLFIAWVRLDFIGLGDRK
jgi:hypothetical protein